MACYFNPSKSECMTPLKQTNPPYLDLFYGNKDKLPVSQQTNLQPQSKKP